MRSSALLVIPMEKSEFLKVRVPQLLKEQIDEIAAAMGRSVSDLVREHLDKLVTEHQILLNQQRVTVAITKPQGYQDGAWKAVVRLKRPEEAVVFGDPLGFFLPDLPRRRVHPDKGYAAALPKTQDYVLGGRLVNGVWEGHIYSNGCAEEDNPTPIEDVQVQIHAAVIRALEGANGLRP